MTELTIVARMNRRLWANCLEGAGDALWARPLPAVNALGFVALHLLDSRHFMLTLLGAPLTNPFAALLSDARSMADLAEHPSLQRLEEEWAHVSDRLEPALDRLTPAERRARPSQRFPIDDPTLGGALQFLLHHESYHIGQMAMLRRCFGLPPMRYG